MLIENTLAKHISATKDKSAYDTACKLLLSDKIILAWIMKSCLEEYKDCEIPEIIQQYITGKPELSKIPVNINETTTEEQIRKLSSEDHSLFEGTVTYDIRFDALAPGKTGEKIRLLLNIEAQNDFYPGYPIIKRGIYYGSRMISSQYGTEFTDAHYEKIKKVYSIWICTNPPGYRAGSINRYAVKEEQLTGNVSEKTENYDLLSVIIICLGDSAHTSGILKLLQVLLSSDHDPEDKKKILQNDFSITMTQKLEREVSVMCNLSKGVEEKGIQKGLKMGREQGILFSIRCLMTNMGWSMEDAMKNLNIPDAEKDNYIAKLKERP